MEAAITIRYSPEKFEYSELKQLVLDGSRIKRITEDDANFLSKFLNLTTFCCSGTGLTSLQNFPIFPKLTKLELQDNALSDSSFLNVLATSTPNLKVLRLAGNRFKDINALIEHLKPLTHLEILDVDLNPFVASNGHRMDLDSVRELIFSALPNIKLSDQKDAHGVEHQDDEGDEDDDEDDIEGEEEDEDEAESVYSDDEIADPSTSLKAFYEHDYNKQASDEDDDDFDPVDAAKELEDDEEEDDEEDDDDKDEDDEDDYDNIEEQVDFDETESEAAVGMEDEIDLKEAAHSKRHIADINGTASSEHAKKQRQV